MTEIKNESALPPIERMTPDDPTQGMQMQAMLDRVGAEVGPKQQIISLAEYVRDVAAKPRGAATGGKEDLNSHTETFITSKGGEIRVASLQDLQQQLEEAGSPVQILGVESVGNNNQRVSAVVQGYNPDNPQSGYERPTVAEGPHMILAPFAFDNSGKLHVFRTVQYRTGKPVIDTPRGFASQKDLETGEKMYDIEDAGEKVQANMQRILKEEQGEKFLSIQRIVYLGAPRVNTSFVTSESALFGVQVDYDSFIRSSKVVTPEEYDRQQEELVHEGLTNIVLDMAVDNYVEYKRDSRLMRDMAADAPSDIVVMDHLFDRMSRYEGISQGRAERIKLELDILRKLKETNPEAYQAYKDAESVVRSEKKVPQEEIA